MSTAVSISPNGAASPPPTISDGLLSIIERAARDGSVDLDKMDRLLAMRERIDAREAARSFNAAISAAKGEIGNIVKNRKVDFTTAKGRTNYRYEDFAEVAKVVDPVLRDHGLSYRFRSSQEGSRIVVTCILSHADGHFEETALSAPIDDSGNKNAIQAIGSSATYLQRYTLKLALGLASSNDDDGRSSVSLATITAAQAAEIEARIKSTGGDPAKFLSMAKLDSFADIPASEYGKAMELVETAAAARAKAAQKGGAK